MAGSFNIFPARFQPLSLLKPKGKARSRLFLQIPTLKIIKMQIRVKCGCHAETCPEWAIVELQGVVESQPSARGQIQNLEIGRLCCAPDHGSHTLTVGYHELSGTKMPLKKPLLVLKKMKVSDTEAGLDSGDSSRVELEVVGIIRRKILFKNRPKALISKPQVKEKKAVQSATKEN